GNLEELLEDINYKILGKTLREKQIEVENEKINLEELIEIWEKPLSSVFPIEERQEIIHIGPKYTKGKYSSINTKIATPKVFIPIFTGTTGEYDMEKSFRNAGGEIVSFVFKTLNLKSIE